MKSLFKLQIYKGPRFFNHKSWLWQHLKKMQILSLISNKVLLKRTIFFVIKILEKLFVRNKQTGIEIYSFCLIKSNARAVWCKLETDFVLKIDGGQSLKILVHACKNLAFRRKNVRTSGYWTTLHTNLPPGHPLVNYFSELTNNCF